MGLIGEQGDSLQLLVYEPSIDNQKKLIKETKIMEIRVEFGGGTELLFGKAKFLNITLENSEQAWTLSGLIVHLSDKYIKERVEFFSIGDRIRPGILILVNGIDYEILGGYDYKIKQGDNVLFISTLHGG